MPRGIRTPDLPLIRRPLYPLSYRPVPRHVERSYTAQERTTADLKQNRAFFFRLVYFMS